MKTVSTIFAILAIINLVLMILSGIGSISHEYLVYGVGYAIMHLTYQMVRGEGVFHFLYK